MSDGERKNKRIGQRLKFHNTDSNECQFMSIPTTLVESVFRKRSVLAVHLIWRLST